MIAYTTRADTLFGATYTVMSPEHPLIEKMKDSITNYDEVLAYKTEAAKKSEFERTELAKEKTGVKLEGIYAVNPANGAKLPVFISDYVLVTYGTGAIMAVPAHDSVTGISQRNLIFRLSKLFQAVRTYKKRLIQMYTRVIW